MELLDLVNMDDNVIGVTDKTQAHATGQIHRVAAVYVFDSTGQLYVQVHKKGGGLYDNSVGGHVSQGETYGYAARREASEELGITQKLYHIATFYSDEGKLMQHMFGLYQCTAESSWTFTPNDEVEEIIPMSIGKINELMRTNPSKFTGGFKSTMRKYLQYRDQLLK